MRARNMPEILEIIKDILSPYIPGNIYDYHVADALRIKHDTIASYKSRDTIPYRQILDFCLRTGINPINIFYRKDLT